MTSPPRSRRQFGSCCGNLLVSLNRETYLHKQTRYAIAFGRAGIAHECRRGSAAHCHRPTPRPLAAACRPRETCGRTRGRATRHRGRRGKLRIRLGPRAASLDVVVVCGQTLDGHLVRVEGPCDDQLFESLACVPARRAACVCWGRTLGFDDAPAES